MYISNCPSAAQEADSKWVLLPFPTKDNGGLEDADGPWPAVLRH